jgi:hypothetical protein
MAGVNRKATRTGNSLFPYVDSRTILDTAKIYVGEMVQQDANFEVAPATDVASVIVLGVSIREVDNTDDGETLEDIESSVLLMDNSESDAVTKAHIGGPCYVEDAATVSSSTTNSNTAGIVTEVTSNGVFVDFDPAKKA